MLEAFEHGTHVIAMNAEVDATLGPILNVYAGKNGVLFSACDGDEPSLSAEALAGRIEDARLRRDVDREPEAGHGAITSSCR